CHLSYATVSLHLLLSAVATLCSFFSFFSSSPPHPDLPSFPTRRSSDLFSKVTLVGNLKNKKKYIETGVEPGLMWHHCKCLTIRRSEEHTSELQSRFDLVCRLLLEKKNKN